MNRVVWHEPLVTRTQREAALRHKAAVVWLTGLPGAGKSTVAHEVERMLFARGCRSFVLDGDNVRHGLCSGLGFSESDRHENIRRVGEVAKLFCEAGTIVLAAFVSPTRASRALVRDLLAPGDFIEVHCRCPVEVCEERDPKGFYALARKGEITHYTGVSAPYEAPLAPELILDTAAETVASCAEKLIQLLENRRIIAREPAADSNGAEPPIRGAMTHRAQLGADRS